MSTTADPITVATSAATDIFQGYVEACSEWQQEIARFVGLRLAANRHSMEALMAAHDATTIVNVQQQWAQQLATDYMQEAGRVMRLIITLSLTGTTLDAQEAARIVG